MSGFVAVLNLDGAACDAAVLRDLTAALAFRGPDGSDSVVRGPIGLGAALFRTTVQAARESQPLSLDGQAWIVGSVRLDDRASLVARLRAAGRHACAEDPDLELVLHAWLVWRADCVTRLLGDFSFVVWDEPREELFAARDHFGVRPLFYAHDDRGLRLSNTLSCLRRHPSMQATLDESFVGDFLLFGFKQSPQATAFREIRRLAAAHRLTFSRAGLSVERYWDVPTYREPLRVKHPAEYVERFRDVMRLAVADRLNAPVVGFELSGGVDSTCVAATACDLRRRGETTTALHAWTFSHGDLLPEDEDPRIAALTAAAIGLPHRTFDLGEGALFRERSGRVVTPGSEPADDSLSSPVIDSVSALAAVGRVGLTGQGGDGILASSSVHVLRMLRRGRWIRAARECGGYLLHRRRLPPLGIRSRLRRRLGIAAPPPVFPGWLEPDFERRLRLRERWTEAWQPRPVAWDDDLRVEAVDSMRTCWASVLEWYDAEAMRTPVEYRHPFFDLRVIDFLLQVPPLPWLAHKDLAREAWPDLLPELVRTRPKVTLRGDPLRARVERGEEAPIEWRTERVDRFVRVGSTPALRACSAANVCHYLAAYPVSLGLWLQCNGE